METDTNTATIHNHDDLAILIEGDDITCDACLNRSDLRFGDEGRPLLPIGWAWVRGVGFDDVICADCRPDGLEPSVMLDRYLFEHLHVDVATLLAAKFSATGLAAAVAVFYDLVVDVDLPDGHLVEMRHAYQSMLDAA